MSHVHRVLACIVLCHLLCSGEVPEVPPSLAVPEGHPAFDMAALRGKVVVVLFYQSWCGICNGWSPTLFKQLTEAFGDDRRVALVAVKTDGGGPKGALAYLEERTDSAPWLVAADPNATWYKQVLGNDALYQYAMIDPAGQIVETGKAGKFFGKADAKVFAMTRLKPPLADAATVLPAAVEYPAAVRMGVTAAEARDYLTALSVAKRAGEDGESLWTDLMGLLKGRATACTETLADTEAPMAKRLPAYLELANLATLLKGSDIAKQAKDPLRTAARDRALKTELKAYELYTSIRTRAAALPEDKREAALADAMGKLAKGYPDTVYGELAGEVE